MSFFDKYFKSKNEECPRCLGKGLVDNADIKRLGREFEWRPGKCAYCQGEGKVDRALLSEVSPDRAYLTVDLSNKERNLLFTNDPNALYREEVSEILRNNFIRQIKYLHFECDLESHKIAGFFFLTVSTGDDTPEYKDDLLRYINDVLNHNKEI
jgi:RecJ-like exonuclease